MATPEINENTPVTVIINPGTINEAHFDFDSAFGAWNWIYASDLIDFDIVAQAGRD